MDGKAEWAVAAGRTGEDGKPDWDVGCWESVEGVVDCVGGWVGEVVVMCLW